jgi:hypothetical protein
MRFEGGDLDRGPARADGVDYTDDKPSSTPVASLCKWPSPITGLDYTDDKPSSTSVVSLCDRPSAPSTRIASRSDRPNPITDLGYTDDKIRIDPVELSPPLDRAEYRDIGDQHKTASDHKECTKSGSIGSFNEFAGVLRRGMTEPRSWYSVPASPAPTAASRRSESAEVALLCS